jgi:hypothetical protein
MVLETSTNSTIERNIYQVLRKHFLEQRPITWKPIKVELVVNTELTDDFFSKFSLNLIVFLYLFFSNKNKKEKVSITHSFRNILQTRILFFYHRQEQYIL